MNVLDCFSGIGGGILASTILGHRVVCAIEKDAYCHNILVKNQNEGFLRPFPIWNDITTFDGNAWRGCINMVQGGFPCQDISIAGKKKGLGSERSGLWFEMFRVICEVRPQWVFIENVANFRRLGLDTVLGCLASIGYDAEWTTLGADDVGANHHRKRLWILAKSADTLQQGLEGLEQNESESQPIVGLCEDVSNADCKRKLQSQGCIENKRKRTCDGCDETNIFSDTGNNGTFQRDRKLSKNQSTIRDGNIERTRTSFNVFGKWWQTEPDVGRLADGFPDRVSALRRIGNAQVPLQAAMAFTILQRRFG